MNAFKEIFSKCDTDKISAGHYEDGYEECFGDIRNDIKLIFEIGVNRGGSVRGWKEYFPNAIVVGMDINGGCYFEDDRIKIEICDATNVKSLSDIIEKYGSPDIVIDDGSHFSSHIKESFNYLYPFAKICYVLEDLGSQYKSFENGWYVNDGIPATILAHQKIDELLQRIGDCKSIKIYNSICFLFKQ